MRRWQYLFYGAGQLGIMLLARFFFQWVLKFSEEPVSAGATEGLFIASSVGLTFFAFRIFDGVTDPAAGILSDWWVRKGRQRRNLLYFSFLLPPVGLSLIFAPSGEMGAVLRWALLCSGMLIFFVGYTLYAIPYWSLIDDYSGDDDERRTRLSNILGGALMLATAIGFIVSPMAVERLGYFHSALIFSAIATGLLLLPIFAKPADVVRKPRGSDEDANLFASFRVAFGHRRFIAVLILFAGSQMSFTIMTGAAPFIAVNLLNATTSDVALIMGPFIATSIPSFLAVPWLTRKIGWEKAALGASVALAFVYAGVGLMGQATVLSPIHTTMALFSLGGPMAAVLLGLEGEVITSCARETGGEVTSVYFGVYNFIVKVMNGLAIFLTGVLADMIATRGAAAVRGMGFAAGGFLVLGVVLYLAFRERQTPAAA